MRSKTVIFFVFCSSLKEMRATTIKSCDWPPCSFRTDIGASIHYPLSRVQLQSSDGDGAQYQLQSLEWWWQWCDYIDDGDEDDDDLSQVQNRKRTTELCINSDPAAFFVPRLPRPCLAPRFARGFTIPTKCICSGLFRIQRGFTISKVHQHLFRILWPCLRKPSNYGLSDSLGHLHSVVSVIINLVDMWFLFNFFLHQRPLYSKRWDLPFFTK